MRVLILSSNTGGGHNSCAGAVQEAFTQRGYFCQTVDAVRFVSGKLSGFLTWGHTTMYRHIPGLFRAGYDFAERHPAMLDEDAAVYRLLTDGTKPLYEFIRAGSYDTVICTHVFSGLLLRQTQKEYHMHLKTAFIATDYTCSPGTARSALDRYFIPAESLKAEYIAQEIPEAKLTVTGIPVREAFYDPPDRVAAKEKLGISPDHIHLLMMCGSMGCGPMEKLAGLLYRQMDQSMELSVICGTNEKLKKRLAGQFDTAPNIRIHGFVRDMGTMLDSADLCLTKPGGLSSTEAAVKRLPMVLIDAVAGCEAYNLRYFVSCGGAVTGDDPEQLADISMLLLRDPAKRSTMADALARAVPSHAARRICEVMAAEPTEIPSEKRDTIWQKDM